MGHIMYFLLVSTQKFGAEQEGFFWFFVKELRPEL